jgi:starvation-inducible DNA-binding protein
MEHEHPYDLSKEGLAKALAEILSDSVTLHYLAQGYHWNVKGPEFSQFHKFFGKIYEDFAESEDETAENIRKLGFDAPFLLHHFKQLTAVEARIVSGDPIQMSAVLYEGNLCTLNRLHDAFTIANAINAQGVADFLAGRISAVEKWVWQLGTTIGADATTIHTLDVDMGKSEAEVSILAVDNDNNVTIAELQPTPESIRAALLAAGRLVPEEQDLAEALIEIADKYGKFDEDQTGIWADYHEPEDNPLAEMGVKCGNCVLFRGGGECAVVAFKVDPEGYCRFAVLPDGTVDPAKAPKDKQYKHDHEYMPGEFAGGAGAPAEVLDMSKVKKPKATTLVADADYGGECPPATQDIQLNLKNRQNAIDNVGYGPLNPKEPSTEFWQEKADKWSVSPEEAKKSICGNCVFFDIRSKTMDCIESGIAEGGSGDESAWDAIDQAELGYCTALDFKCAASRTCNAWAVGGPVTDESERAVNATGFKPIFINEEDMEFSADGPCWDGYKQVGMKMKDGKEVPNCVPDNEASVTATAGSKPAPKKDQIKGSKKNKKGSAAGGRKVTFSKKTEDSLKNKVETHNKSVESASRKVTMSQLKAVYRRGAGAFSTSHRPDQNRNSWAMARVNAFLQLVKSGKPSNPKYVQDNDLLPKGHPKSTIKASASMTASAFADLDLYIELKDESEYENPEEALLAFAEYSGLGYESIPTFRAAWRRGVNAGESPFDRAANLAIELYDSEDADLLPKPEKD